MKKSLQMVVLLGATLIFQSSALGVCEEILEKSVSIFRTGAHEATESAKIFAGSVAAAAIYAILNDQVTARICLPYFTKGFHERNLQYWTRSPVLRCFKSFIDNNPTSPTIVGATWGTVAGGHMGILLGIRLVLASRIGSPAATSFLGAATAYQAIQFARGKSGPLGLVASAGLTAVSHALEWPQMELEEMVKPTAVALGATGAGALVGGIVAYLIGKAKTNRGIRNTLGSAASGVSDNDLHNFFTCAGAHNGAYTAGALAGIGLTGYVLYQRYTKAQ